MEQQQQKQFTKYQSSNTLSLTSGGTASVLVDERKKAKFNVDLLTNILDGGSKEATARKRFIRGPMKNKDYSHLYNLDRPELLVERMNEFINVHKPFSNFKPTRHDIAYMSEIAGLGGASLWNQLLIFIPVVQGQCDKEQQEWWLKKAYKFQIIGCYAQTELGHGSNVRGIQTTAHYDQEKQEFILNTPTLQSIKWWPGSLGKISNFAVVYAQLILNNQEYGVHAFMMQIRDENHLPLPGIEIGDIGSKMGDLANDTGYMVLKNVRIPRRHMLAKFQYVDEMGKYVEQNKADKKTHYASMMFTRAQLVFVAAAKIGQAATIATRYSCVRKQGFKNASVSNISFKSEENAIIDYQIQQYRVLKQIAVAYAIKITALWMLDRLKSIESTTQIGEIKNASEMKEISATSAGLKALCTKLATEGIEDLRKCCGGNGYLLSSGIAQISLDYLWQYTAEGDFAILTLFASKFIIKEYESLLKQNKRRTGMMKYLNGLIRIKQQVLKDDDWFQLLIPKPASKFEDFLNIEYLQQWFQYKILKKIILTERKIKHKIKNENKSVVEAQNECANDLAQVGLCHGQFIMFQNFVNFIHKITDQQISQVMCDICALFGCQNIRDDSMWGGIFEPLQQFDLVSQAIANLLPKIRSQAVPLVDAFDFPDNVLNSTIGSYDGNVYERLCETAEKSTLNRVDPFEGYEEVLKPHLDLQLLAKKNFIPKL